MFRSLLFLAAFLSAGSAFSAPVTLLSRYELHRPSPETLVSVAKLFEVTNRHGDDYEILVPESQASALALVAPTAELKEYDIRSGLRARLASFAEAPFATARGYRDFDEVQAWLKAAVAAHPAIASLVDYGQSGDKRPLRALRLTGPDTGRAKPTLVITAATHGDEIITTEVLTRLVDEILGGYGHDPRFTRMVDDHELFFIPVVNADGFAERDRYDYGQDPNRSYPYPNDLARAPTPSIKAIMAFFDGRNVAGSIDFYAYGEMTMYPWAYTYDPIAADADAKLNGLTAQMSEQNSYAHGPISKVIYVAPGSSCDYYFWKKGTLAVAIEMGQSKSPNPREIPDYVKAQEESTWRFIESF